jgi:polar amino acid transport system substrate-binding protein
MLISPKETGTLFLNSIFRNGNFQYIKEREVKKITFVMSVLVLASLILAGCGAQPTTAPATAVPPTEVPPTAVPPAEVSTALPDLGGKTITVAVENAYPPFNSIDQATGQGAGWDYDAVREICHRLNCVAEFKQAAWDGIFPAMQAGEFDMLADGVTVTAERALIVAFSTPYVEVNQYLLVRVAETRTPEQMKADANAKIGTQIGTTNEIAAKAYFTGKTIQSFEDFGAAVLALKSGDIDGVVIDNIAATGFMKENEGVFKMAGQIMTGETLAFVFPQNSTLKDPVNAALASMTADGTLEQINRKWGLIPPTEVSTTLPDLGGKTITVAVENAYPPFNSIDQATGQGAGWDYDAVREICHRLNCVAEFKQAAWDGIFPAMQAGEFDMLADGVTVTAERALIVAFSTPYVEVNQYLLVRVAETRTPEQMKADANAKIGTQIGTTNEIAAKAYFTGKTIQSFEDFGAAVLALKSGDIDGVVIDNIAATGFMKENEGVFKMAGQIMTGETLAFVFPQNSTLKDPVNAALASMTADGTLEQINRKWGLIP